MGSTPWNKALHDGIQNVNTTDKSPYFKASIKKAAEILKQKSSNGIDLVLYVKHGMGDGQFSNNPWLQELPDPISKATWDNYLTVSPRFAKELGLANEYVSNGALNGDVVDLSANGTSVRVPVLIQPRSGIQNSWFSSRLWKK
ncbi:MAG: hypothetical protein CM15mP23_16670 [Cryomorphaceae bacterium]|nr:MAG: hypothetical protein CM15mP23_16670 [Cryomorphaceae bacterium]